MKWHFLNIFALFAIPVVPSLAVYFGYLSDKDNQSAAGLLSVLCAISFVARWLADREADERSILWLVGTAAATFFFGYSYITGHLPGI